MLHMTSAKSLEVTTTSSDQTEALAEQLGKNLKGGEVIELVSDLGGGKTTFVRGFLQGLGYKGKVKSPSYNLVEDYEFPDKHIYHFDFYRLKKETEAMDMGFEEYLYSGNYCFIEWPEKIPDLLPGHYISIKILVESDNSRRISIENI